MQKVEFENAYYIKLGRKGEWAQDSINNARARIGWKNIALSLIRDRNWETIEQKNRQDMSESGTGAATADFRALQKFCLSTSQDIWITFHKSKLWWGRLKGEVQEDEISKYREVEGGWNFKDIKGCILFANQISGRLAQLQGFRATICTVHETDYLRRLINAEQSPEYAAARDAKVALVEQIAQAIKTLHPKDFELLVDLVFRQSGWRRVSVLGETMKFVDMEFEDSITGDLYQVQVKSKASKQTFDEYADQFSASDFRMFYFVVHTPEGELKEYESNPDDEIQLIKPARLAEMVVDGGLTNWVMDKIK